MPKKKSKRFFGRSKSKQQDLVAKKDDHTNDARKARSETKAKAKPKTVKIMMKTSYRDVAKAGEVWETDPAKAAELIKLGRAKEIPQK